MLFKFFRHEQTTRATATAPTSVEAGLPRGNVALFVFVGTQLPNRDGRIYGSYEKQKVVARI